MALTGSPSGGLSGLTCSGNVSWPPDRALLVLIDVLCGVLAGGSVG